MKVFKIFAVLFFLTNLSTATLKAQSPLPFLNGNLITNKYNAITGLNLSWGTPSGWNGSYHVFVKDANNTVLFDQGNLWTNSLVVPVPSYANSCFFTVEVWSNNTQFFSTIGIFGFCPWYSYEDM